MFYTWVSRCLTYLVRLVRCVMYLGFWMFEVSDKVSYRCYLRRFLDFKAVWSFRYCQLSHLSFVYLRVSLCVSVSVIVVLVVLTALYFSVQHHCLRSGSATLCVQQHLIQIQDNSEILHQSLGVSIQQTALQLCFLLLLFKIVSVLGFTFLHKLSKHWLIKYWYIESAQLKHNRTSSRGCHSVG